MKKKFVYGSISGILVVVIGVLSWQNYQFKKRVEREVSLREQQLAQVKQGMQERVEGELAEQERRVQTETLIKAFNPILNSKQDSYGYEKMEYECLQTQEEFEIHENVMAVVNKLSLQGELLLWCQSDEYVIAAMKQELIPTIIHQIYINKVSGEPFVKGSESLVSMGYSLSDTKVKLLEWESSRHMSATHSLTIQLEESWISSPSKIGEEDMRKYFIFVIDINGKQLIEQCTEQTLDQLVFAGKLIKSCTHVIETSLPVYGKW